MKIIVYYVSLLILIALVTIFLLNGDANAMSMKEILTVCTLLSVYAISMSLIGEGKLIDERELQHRYMSHRLALAGGTIVLSIGVLYQLLHHNLDYWLLAGLITINIIKIISLLYSNYNR